MAATVWGVLGLQDATLTVQQVGESVVYEAVQRITELHNDEIAQIMSIFVAGDTTDFKIVYKQPGGGQMQESDEWTRPGAVKGGAQYEVAFDLRDFRDQIAANDISLAYMTLQDFQTVLNTILIRHANTVRFQILRHLLNKTNETFEDRLFGTLTVRRLANGDGTLYSPTQPGADPAEETHYIGSNYADSAISDTNNPIATGREQIEEHFGSGNLIGFINQAQTLKVSALSDFVPVADPNIQPAAANATLVGGPGVLHPGRIIGRVNETWIAEWRNWPAGYVGVFDAAQPAPLMRRLDIPTDIDGRGMLALVSSQTEFPLQESFYRDRHGFGAANRLNGVIIHLNASTTYTTPTAYA